MKKPYFYVAAACIFFTGMALQSVSGVSSAHLRDVGFDESFIATVVSVHAFALAAFKFLSGISYDRFGLKKTMLICDSAAVVMTLLLALVRVGPGGSVVAMCFGVISSLAMPMETIMLPLIASDMFGRRDYAKFLGIFVSINTAGYAVGVPVANLCYDFYQSYTPIMLLFSGGMAVVMVVIQFALRFSERERKVAA